MKDLKEPTQPDLTDSLLLTAAFIESKQFELCPPCTQFEGLNMSYYARNGVLLFFNENRLKYELSYYAGYGEMRMGKYHAVAFRWIDKQYQLSEIYKALTGESI